MYFDIFQVITYEVTIVVVINTRWTDNRGGVIQLGLVQMGHVAHHKGGVDTLTVTAHVLIV